MCGNHLAGSEKIFRKGPDNKQFKFCKPDGLCCNDSGLYCTGKGSSGQYVKEWA